MEKNNNVIFFGNGLNLVQRGKKNYYLVTVK